MKKIITNLLLMLIVCVSSAWASETVGATDNTAGWWSAFSSYYTMTANQKAHITFKNCNSGTGGNYNNWVLAVTSDAERSATGYEEYLILRNDNYGWGNYYYSGGLSSNFNFDGTTFVTDMNNSTVDMYLTFDDGRINMTSTITTEGGTVYNYSCKTLCVPTKDKYRFFFTVDASHIEDLTVSYEDYTPTTSMKAISTTTTETVGSTAKTDGWWTAFSPYYTVKDGQMAVVTFTDYIGTATYQNWTWVAHTQGTQRSGDGYSEYMVLRSDAYGWNSAGNTNSTDATVLAQIYSVKNNDFVWGTDNATFISDRNGASVQLKVYPSNGYIVMQETTTNTSGTAYHQNYVSPSESGMTGFTFFLTPQESYLSNVTTTIYGVPYTVTYHNNGHGTTPDAIETDYLPDELPTMTADGYTFDGWFTDEALTTAAVAGAHITAATDLYAKWSEASAGPTTLYERGTTNAWSADDVTAWGGNTNLAVDATNGLGFNTTNPGSAYSATKTFVVTDNAKVTYDVTWYTGNSTYRTSNFEYIQFGDKVRLSYTSDYNYYIDLTGTSTTTTSIEKYQGLRANAISITFNTATKSVEKFTFNGTDIASKVTGALDGNFNSVTFGYQRGGSGANWAYPNYLTKIQVSEEQQSVTTADYTVNYKNGDDVVKTVSSSTTVGSVITADRKITGTDEVTYLADDATLPSMTIAAGTNELNVNVHKQKTATLKVTTKVGDDDATVATTNLVEADDLSCNWSYAFPLYKKNAAGVYYKTAGIVNDNATTYGEGGTFIDGETIEKTVTYGTADPSIVYFTDASTTAGTDYTYSNGESGHVDGQNAKNRGLSVGDLAAGKYQFNVMATGKNGRCVVLRSGTNDPFATTEKISATGLKTIDFTLDAETSDIWLNGSNQTDAKTNQSEDFDYCLIKKLYTATFTATCDETPINPTVTIYSNEAMTTEVSNGYLEYGKTYYYKAVLEGYDDNTGSLTVSTAANPSISFTMTKQYAYTVMAKNGDTELATIASGYATKGTEKTFYFSKYIQVGDIWYVTDATSYSTTVNETTPNVTVSYSAATISQFFEANDMSYDRTWNGSVITDNAAYSSGNGVGVGSTSASYSYLKTKTTIPAGTYNIGIYAIARSNKTDDVKVYTSTDNSTWTEAGSFTMAAATGLYTTSLTLAADSYVRFSNTAYSSNMNHYYDYVTFTPAYSYTVKTSLGTTLASGTASAGSTVSYAYPRYINNGGTLYEAGKASEKGTWYGSSFTLTQDNQEVTVEYTATTITNVVYFSEGENITGATATSAGNNMVSRSSNGQCGYAANDITLVTLPAGTYTVKSVQYSNSSGGLTLKYQYGETEIDNTTSGANNTDTKTNDITITETTDFKWLASGSAKNGLDFVYITGTPTNSIIGALDKSTGYRGAKGSDITLAKGNTYYVKFQNHGTNTENYKNWLLDITSNSTLATTLRADWYAFGVGTFTDAYTFSTDGGATKSSGSVWDTFSTDMTDATVELVLAYSSEGVLSVKGTATKDNDIYYYDYSYTASSDNVTLNLSVENAWLEVLQQGTATAASLGISSVGWATFIAPFECTIPAGVTAYVVSGTSGTSLIKTAVETGKFAANTPYLVKYMSEGSLAAISKTLYGVATNGSQTIFGGDDTNALVGNVGDATEVAVGTTKANYLLQNKSNKLGFYKVAATGLKVGKNRCYLSTTEPVSTAKPAYFFDDNIPTDIDVLIPDAVVAKNGVRKYVKNGKLFIETENGTFNATGAKIK